MERFVDSLVEILLGCLTFYAVLSVVIPGIDKVIGARNWATKRPRTASIVGAGALFLLAFVWLVVGGIEISGIDATYSTRSDEYRVTVYHVALLTLLLGALVFLVRGIWPRVRFGFGEGLRSLLRHHGRPAVQSCETCSRRMTVLDNSGRGGVALSLEEMASGIGHAEQCWECDRLYCSACYPSRQPNTCVCGRGRDAVRRIGSVINRGSLRLVKVRYRA